MEQVGIPTSPKYTAHEKYCKKHTPVTINFHYAAELRGSYEIFWIFDSVFNTWQLKKITLLLW